MYFWIALVSMFGGVVHILFFTKYARRIDGISLSFYRTCSLIFTMLPILFFADMSKLDKLMDYFPIMLLGGFAGGISIVLNFESQKYLPVGVSTSLGNLTTVVVVLGSYFLFDEKLTYISYIGITMIRLVTK